MHVASSICGSIESSWKKGRLYGKVALTAYWTLTKQEEEEEDEKVCFPSVN